MAKAENIHIKVRFSFPRFWDEFKEHGMALITGLFLIFLAALLLEGVSAAFGPNVALALIVLGVMAPIAWLVGSTVLLWVRWAAARAEIKRLSRNHPGRPHSP